MQLHQLPEEQVILIGETDASSSSLSSVFKKKLHFRTILIVLSFLTVILFVFYTADVKSISLIFSPILNPNGTILSNSYGEEDSNLSKAEISAKTRHKLKIWFWTTFFGKADFGTGFGDEYYRKINCPFICEHTASKKELNSSDALIFHVRDTYMPLPADRWLNQKWIYYMMESPVHTYPRDAMTDELFNWTMTFNRQSDVWFPYSTFMSRPQPVPMKPVSLEGKKLAAWLVSNCNTNSRREELFDKHSKYISIDNYGRCGGQACSLDSMHCYAKFGKEYLFYLSWENSLCEDYVTDKLWLPLNAGMVPVVYGGSEYEKLLPPHSFIDITSFNSVKDLATYLQMLSTNLTAYQEYHRWTERYQILPEFDGFGWCQLCETLHREQDNRTTTNVKISEFWSTERLCSKKNGDKDRLMSNS